MPDAPSPHHRPDHTEPRSGRPGSPRSAGPDGHRDVPGIKPFSAVAGLGILVLLVVASYFGLLPPGPAGTPAGGGAPASGQPISVQPAPAPAATGPTAGQSQPPAATQVRAADQLRLGTWNIEWLGRPFDRSGVAKGTAQSAADIADYIAFARVDILALQEIVVDEGQSDPGSLRSGELDSVVAQLERKVPGPWRYVLFPGRRPGDQLTGVLWNSKAVRAVGAGGRPFPPGLEQPLRLSVKTGQSSQRSTLFARPPHAMKFSCGDKKTDFVLSVVHLKADYDGDFAAHRKEEASALVVALPSVEKSLADRDVVVLGDTNITGKAEPAEGVLAGAGLIDVNTQREATHWRGGTTDRIYVPGEQPEFVAAGCEVISDRWLEAVRWKPTDFKRRLSDHYMVVTTIRIMEDDD